MLISNVMAFPSKSKAVKLPAEEFNPPMILDIPNCSKSILAPVPDWSTNISLSAACSGKKSKTYHNCM